MRRIPTLALALGLSAAVPAVASASVGLRGSPSSMVRQHAVAVKNDYTFLRTPAQIEHFVEEGWLVPVAGNADLRVSPGVGHAVARPELRTFVTRLAAEYRQGCGEPLVVTSLTRALSEQPRNAHPLSVHPAGMAVDLRVSESARCRSWLESTLLSLEGQKLLDVTREHHPPHYHVALFTGVYREHVAELLGDSAAALFASRAEQEAQPRPAAAPEETIELGRAAGSSAFAAAKPTQRGRGPWWVPLALLGILGVLGAAAVPRRPRGWPRSQR